MPRWEKTLSDYRHSPYTSPYQARCTIILGKRQSKRTPCNLATLALSHLHSKTALPSAHYIEQSGVTVWNTGSTIMKYHPQPVRPAQHLTSSGPSLNGGEGIIEANASPPPPPPNTHTHERPLYPYYSNCCLCSRNSKRNPPRSSTGYL